MKKKYLVIENGNLDSKDFGSGDNSGVYVHGPFPSIEEAKEWIIHDGNESLKIDKQAIVDSLEGCLDEHWSPHFAITEIKGIFQFK